MSKVSSSNGLDKRPRLRFPGFDEPLAKFEIGNACEQLKETIDPRTTPTEFYAEYSMPAFDNNRKVAKVQGKDMNSARKVMSKPCVLINKLNVRKKRIWLVDHPEKNAVSSTEFVPLSSTMMSLGYLNYVALTDRFTNYMLNCSSGSSNSQKRVTPDDILDYVITAPSLLEQERIARFLETIDSKIRAQEDLIELLKKYKRGLLQDMFPKKGATVPKLRLAGFTGAWEQRKLGEVVQITMGQSPDGSTYSDVPSDYILVQGNADLENGWVKPRVWTTQITKQADAGDLIMSVRAPAGAMGKTAYNAVIGRGVAAIKGNEFIYQLLVKMDVEGFWKKDSTGSTFESLNSDSIKNAEIKIPFEDEQWQIGEYFRNLDHLITLHQSKLVLLRKQKNGLLQQLFI